MTKADFIICAPLHLAFKSSRALALVQLARSLEKAGRTAHLCASMETGDREVVFGIDFDTYTPVNDMEREFVATIQRVQREFGIKLLKDFSPLRIAASYVVYSEGVTHNPLSAERVIRYFQNKDGARTGKKVNVGHDDFILAQSRVMHPAPHHVAFFAQIDPVFHNRGTETAEKRTLDLTSIGGSILRSVEDAVPQTVAITRTDPATKEDLATLLRSCRFFYTANPASHINVEALACGAIPAYLDNGPFTHDEIDAFEAGPFPRLYEGIQTGDNFFAEFEAARTAHFERLDACNAQWDTSVAQLIEKADAHFAARSGLAIRDTTPAAASDTSGANGCRPTVFGEKAGERAFYPYRKKLMPSREAPVTKWIATRLVAPLYGNDPGLAIQNQTEYPVKSGEFVLPAKQLALVTYPGETMAARVHLAAGGIYGFVAAFAPATSPGNGAFATVCVNGATVWRSALGNASVATHAGYLKLAPGSIIDFAVEIEAATAGRSVPVVLKFGVIEYNPSTNLPAQRRDDNCSMIDTEQVVQWLAQTPFAPEDVPGAIKTLDERADLFERHWTLDKQYIESQFARTPRDIVRDALDHAGNKPAIRYAICLTPRSGSTLLTEILAATGKLGYPIEYFVPDAIRCLSLALSDTFPSYEALITEGFQSANGVFGIEIEGERFFQERAFFSSLRGWRVVYMTRRDLLAQAISFSRSLASGTWHSFGGTDARQEKPLDRNTIVHTVNFLLRQERAFEQVFREEGVEALPVTYEELVAEPAAFAHRIAHHIGVDGLDFSAVDIGATKLKPTSRAINRQYERDTVMTGGAFNGYDMRKLADDRYVATLAGVDPGLLPPDEERAPVQFVARSLESLKARLATYIARLHALEGQIRAPGMPA